jgi:predicted RND superfamily exporter protein
MTLQVLPPLMKVPEEILKEAYELGERIKQATELLNAWTERRADLLQLATSQGITVAGNYAIETKETVRRKVNVDRFRAMFPDEYARLISDEIRRAKMNAGKLIRVQDAERMLGKDQLDPVCDLQSTVTHVVVKKQNDGTEEGA